MTCGVYPGRKRNMLSYLYIPFLVAVLLIGVFFLVRLRSGVISMEYRIGEMEAEKKEALRMRKTLEARMVSMASVGYLESSGLLFPSDRKRVFYVKRDGGALPYTASLRRD